MDGDLTTISTFGWFGASDPLTSISVFGWDGAGAAVGFVVAFAGSGYITTNDLAVGTSF